MKSNLELETTKHMINCINFIRRRKSVEFGTFPGHITLSNACDFFGDKTRVTANKRFATETVRCEPRRECVSKT